MSSRPSVLLLDDGELDRIRHLLEELEARVDDRRAEPVHECVEGPYDVVVTTVKRALELPPSVRPGTVSGKPVWIAVHNQDFLPLRDRLRELGIDFLIHWSAAPASFRLLLLRALYRGPEKRDGTRVPVGSELTYRDPEGVWRATLLDLTRGGCQLLSPHATPLESRVSISLPPLLAGKGKKELALPGRVVRVEPSEEGGAEAGHRIGVAFEDLARDASDQLDAILTGHVLGTAVTPLAEAPHDGAAQRSPGAADEADDSEQATPAAVEPQPVERRSRRRVAYTERVLALLGEAQHVILGRDLSSEGMRVEHRPELPVGTSLELAIYSSRREEPAIVHATVIRHDGEHATALRFEGTESDVRERIEGIVTAGPAVESLAGSGDDERAVVVSKRITNDSGSTSSRS